MLRNYSMACRRAKMLHSNMRMLHVSLREPISIGARSTVKTLNYRYFSCSSLRRSSSSRDFIDLASVEKPDTEVLQDDLSLLDVVEESSLNTDSALEAVDSSFHFSNFFSVFPDTIESMLQYIHATTGMPWWLTVITCTVAARSAMLPLMIHMRSMSKRLAVIKPRFDELKTKVTEYQMAGDYVRMREASDEMKRFLRAHNVKPWMTVLPMFVQGSLFASFFFGLRHLTMAENPVGSLTSEGGLWFSNLTVPDPYYILPLINCGFISASLWLNMTDAGEVSEQMETMKPVLYIFNVVFLFICAKFPSGVVLYMATSSLYSLVYATITKKVMKNSQTGKKVELISPEKARKAGQIRRVIRDRDPKS